MVSKAMVSRRAFLASAAAGLGVPYILTGAALGAPGKPAASDKIIMGHIGVGGMGSGHLGVSGRPDVHSVAVSDVDTDRRESAGRRLGPDASLYNDYRELLDRQDIDAVVVASPDHWHALHTIHACESGKDVYCEKPLCVTIQEGQAMVRAARRYNRIVQTGSQGRSQRGGRLTAQYIRNGYCGKIKEVRCWHYDNPTTDLSGDCDPPKGLDWEMWLGPMPWAQYNPKRCPGNFRWFLDDGGGNIRDRGAHIFNIVNWCLGVDNTSPTFIEATGTAPQGLYDVPTTMTVKYEYKDPDVTVWWEQPGEPQGGAYGAKFYGTKDDLVVIGCDGVGAEPKVMFEARPGEETLYISNDHMGNLLECIKTRKLPIVDVEIGYHIATVCILGNLAYRIGRRLHYDPVKQEFVDDDKANRMLGYSYRKPWHL